MSAALTSLRINPRYIYASYITIFCLAILAGLNYKGNIYVYIGFTIVSNYLLYMGFRRKAIFFDTFIGVLLWLGFWLKLSIRVAFFDGAFFVAVGEFDGGGEAFDRALLVSSCGLLGLVIASHFREKFIFHYPKRIEDNHDSGLFRFYRNNRNIILISFITMVIVVAGTNAYFGIYQRGSIPRTVLPYGLSGIYKWLLLFGMASITAMIVRFEYVLHKGTTLNVAIIGIFEGFLSNLSLLSRGMLMNIGALGYGIYKSISVYKQTTSRRFWVVAVVVFVLFFFSSVFLVNYIRVSSYMAPTPSSASTSESLPGLSPSKKVGKSFEHSRLLFIDRWVGIEAVMAVSSNSMLGWPMWKKAWGETYSLDKLSFYDTNLIQSPYQETDLTKHHFVSLPGIIAFCFYPDSYGFLFGCMVLLGVLASLIELFVFKLSDKNLILCALLAQIVAFRFAHYGYVPAQSHLLFGALFLNVFIFYFINKLLILVDMNKREVN